MPIFDVAVRLPATTADADTIRSLVAASIRRQVSEEAAAEYIKAMLPIGNHPVPLLAQTAVWVDLQSDAGEHFSYDDVWERARAPSHDDPGSSRGESLAKQASTLEHIGFAILIFSVLTALGVFLGGLIVLTENKTAPSRMAVGYGVSALLIWGVGAAYAVLLAGFGQLLRVVAMYVTRSERR